MSVGISAICESGNTIVLASDGMISSGVSVDVKTYKLRWFRDLVFSFAGTFSNADLIYQEISSKLRDEEKIGRDRLQEVLRESYQNRLVQSLEHQNLASIDMCMDEFKRDGLKMFGEAAFTELLRNIEYGAQSFSEEVLVGGFVVDHPLAVLYVLNRDDIVSHCIDGIAAIGSGGEVAMTTLMLLQCARHIPLEFAIYAVAAAKFSAESCNGVGKSTALTVVRKNDRPGAEATVKHIIQPAKIDELRKAWNTYGRPKIPVQALSILGQIAHDAGVDNNQEHLKEILKSVRSETQK